MNSDETSLQADEIFRQEILRARAMPPEEKLLAGIRMFEKECELARQAIRESSPELSDEQVEQILRARLEEQRRSEKRGVLLLP